MRGAKRRSNLKFHEILDCFGLAIARPRNDILLLVVILLLFAAPLHSFGADSGSSDASASDSKEPQAIEAVSKLAEPSIKEPITVNGDTVEYFHEEKTVVGTDNVSIIYKDVVLTCDKITVHLDTREAVAEGNVKITQKGAFLTGEKISYNFDTRKGSIIDGDISAPPFYGKAKMLGKAANKDTFTLRRGHITTCDLDHPHYRLQARQIKVYLGDKVVARDILIFLGDVPIFYLPYYSQSLKDQKSHITVIPGRGKDWGNFVLTAYRLNFSDYHKADILIDYRTKKGLAEGLDYYYDTREVGKGSFKFYYTHENDNLAYSKTGQQKTRYEFQARHKWDITENGDTTALLEFNKLSDPDVIKDYLYNEYEELGTDPDNYVSIIKTGQQYNFQFLVRKRFNDFQTVVERLPEMQVNVPNYRIGNTSFYWSSANSGGYLNQKFAESAEDQKDINITRVDSYNQVSYAARVLRAISINPYAGIRETYFSRNKWGDTNLLRTIFDTGISTSTKFYKIYDVDTNRMGLDIHKLRHIITPSANYYYTHQPSISRNNLNQFDSIDSLDKQNGVLLAIENKLQTKRYDNGKNLKSVDLATLIISSDYMFRLKKDSFKLKRSKFKSVDFLLEVVPYEWAYLRADASVDTKRSVVQTSNVDLVAHWEDKWSIAVGHRYENVESGISNLINMDGIYKINDKWKVRAYGRYNFGKSKIEEQEYTIYRDLHCWMLEVTLNIKDPNDQTLWFTLRMKAFPEYTVGLKRTYSRPRFGSTGDTVTSEP